MFNVRNKYMCTNTCGIFQYFKSRWIIQIRRVRESWGYQQHFIMYGTKSILLTIKFMLHHVDTTICIAHLSTHPPITIPRCCPVKCFLIFIGPPVICSERNPGPSVWDTNFGTEYLHRPPGWILSSLCIPPRA